MYPIEVRTDDRLATGLDKGLFFIIFTVGSVAILTEKQFIANRWLPPATGALAILTFCGLTWKSPRFRLREDRIGDGAYYLGFLFTLVSLSYALYQFTEQGVEGVINGFGVALATTIVGLALRVVFQQLREDPIEIEQEVRQTLSEQVIALEREVRLSVESLVALRNRTNEEMRDAVGSGLKAILADSRAATLEQVDAFKVAIGASLTTLNEIISAATAHAAETRKSTSRLLKAVETLAEKIDQTKPPTEGFREKIDDFTSTLDRMLKREAERIEKSRESADAILEVYRDMETRAVEAASAMEQCKKAITGMQDSLARSSETSKTLTDRATAAIDDVLERSRRHLELMARVEAMSTESERSLRSLTKTLEGDVQMSSAALSAVQRNVVEAAELVVRELHAK